MDPQFMSFYGASISADGKVFALGEEKTEVTITRASLRVPDKAKDGQRICLWAAPPNTEDWAMMTSLRVGANETMGLKLCIPADGEIMLKVTPKQSCGIDLVGYQSLPEAFGVEGHGEEGHVHGEGCGHTHSHSHHEDSAPPSKKRKAEEEAAKEAVKAAKAGKEEGRKEGKGAAKKEEGNKAEGKKEAEGKKQQQPRKEEVVRADEAANAKKQDKPRAEPDFISSKKFTGSKPGYVFKKDSKGLGYYKDVPPKVGVKGGKQSAADKWAASVVEQQQWRKGPGGMKMRDTVVGKGTDTPRRGRRVTVHYTGKLTNGKQFDSSVGRAPFRFIYGGGEVIKGWDMGLDGMRVGGTRELELPPAMGYGARGAPPDIPRNATLKFTVQLLGV